MNAIDFKHALVVGLGFRTGLATANFLAERNVAVTVSDRKDEAALADIIQELDSRVTLICGEQNPGILENGYDIIILSPGVPKAIPLIQQAMKMGIPVISEIELAYRFLKGHIIAITGTDGKSTTTTLVGHILKQLKIETFVGGNIGIPLISLADKTTDESVTVIELSSFQLETIKDFKADAAAILNVTPDHLDRYDGMNDYFDAKQRIVKNQSPEDYFIYNWDDEIVKTGLEKTQAQTVSFSLENHDCDSFYNDSQIYIRENATRKPVIQTEKMRIIGRHNIQNAMAALLMVTSVLKKRKIAYTYEAIADAVYSFQGLEHRMEVIGSYMGRIFVNDSKATTVGAVEMAIQSLRGNGVLILGGRTKGDDYARLVDSLAGRITGLVLIGESKHEFADIFRDYTCRLAEDFTEAVMYAMQLSSEGDTVLLSPACASFDMFKSYEERGAVFKEAFNKLTRGEITWT